MNTLRIGSVLGFEIRVHVSWLVIFALVVHAFAVQVLPVDLPALGPAPRLAIATLTALLFFASLLGHELAHAAVARRRGVAVQGITLFLFGGVALLETEPERAGDEAAIAVAGPIASVALALAAWSLVRLLDPGTVAALVGVYLATMNLVLAVFNLLPAFPMDGGRLVRAAVWRATGDAARATRWAARTGEGFALVLVGLGAWRLGDGAVVAGLWLAMIGWFVFTAARRTLRTAAARAPALSRPAAEALHSSMFVIPDDRLPEGFGARIDSPPEHPAVPRPAATVVLLRDGDAGPELLLLRRHHASGFVPGAWVFPGGRVDPADADPRLLERGVDPARAGPDGAPYWAAAVREAFEETGVLLARDRDGRPVPDAAAWPELEAEREALLTEAMTLPDLLERHDLRLDLADVVYVARWITPVAEPRRYDTRFFLARLPEGARVASDPREMTDDLWIAPARALERFAEGRLPMVFPTVRTIESLAGYESVAAALRAFRGRAVEPILPRLVRTEGGVGIVVD